MKPIRFKEVNKWLDKPESMTTEECKSMFIYTDNRECISCWRLTFWERMKILFLGKLWVRIVSGKTQPPIALTIAKTIFELESK